MTETNQILFNRRREEIVYAIKCHSDFIISRLEALNKTLAISKGAHYALLTEQIIAASSSIPLIVKELGSLREEYASLSNRYE